MFPGTLAMNSVPSGQSANWRAPKCGGPQKGLFANKAIMADCLVTCWIKPDAIRTDAKSPRATGLNANGCVARTCVAIKSPRHAKLKRLSVTLRFIRVLGG